MAIGWKYSSTPSSGSLAGAGSYVGINTDGVFVLTSSGGAEWDGTTTNAISGSSTLTIEGESILKGALNVTGAATMKGGVLVTNASAISASGPMTIEGESILKGALAVSGTVTVAGDIVHGGDPNTYLRFEPDLVNLIAGGKSAIKLELSTGKIQLNNGNDDLDVQAMADDGEVILHTDGATNRVGIGTDAPSHTLTVAGAISGSSALTIEGESILKGALNVTGAATVKGGLLVTNASAISASGPMTIEGESILKGPLAVSGASTFAGISTHTAHPVFNTGITIKNADASAGYINFYEQSSNGTNVCTFRGKSSMGNCTITLPGDTGTVVLEDNTVTLSNKTLTSPTITGASITATTISASSALTIEGESILKGALNVTGAATVKGGLLVTNASAISASGPMTIEGETILKGALKVTGSVVAIGGVSVGAAPAIGILPNGSISGSGEIYGFSLRTSGDLSTSGSVTAIGGVSIGAAQAIGLLPNGSISGSGETYAFNLRTSGDLNASGSIYADDISGSGNIYATEITGGGINRHFINYLTMSRPSATQVAIATGSCTDSTNRALMINTASITIDITDSGIDGLDAGSEATSTWYAVYLVSGANGMGGLLSTSEHSPTMPSGYTYKRRVGWVRNHSDDNLLDFRQTGYGRERACYWNEAYTTTAVVSNGASSGVRTAVDCSAMAPPSANGYTATFNGGNTTDQYRDLVQVCPLVVSGTFNWVNIRGGIAGTTEGGGTGIDRACCEFPVARHDGQILGFNYITYYNGNLTANVVGWKETI